MATIYEPSAESPHPSASRRPSPAPPPTTPPGRGWRRRNAPPVLPRTSIPAVKEAARDLRARSTNSEQILWSALRGSRLGGLKFRRQHPMGQFVLDFYCPEKRLAVEIDGNWHEGREPIDQERQAILEAMGICFVRLSASQLETDLISTLQAIERAAFANPSPRRTGEGMSATGGLG